MEPPAEDALFDYRNKPVGIIGDSTFFHSGVTSLMDVAYNGGKTLNIILDNSTTAMTGGQDNPGTGKTLLGKPSNTVDIPALCRALGIKRVTTVDPYNLAEVERVLREELAADEASVVIAKAPCVLEYKIRRPVYQVDADLCIGCKRCLQAGCVALNLVVEVDTDTGTNADTDADAKRKVEINVDLCDGCGICSQLCKENAIGRGPDDRPPYHQPAHLGRRWPGGGPGQLRAQPGGHGRGLRRQAE